MTPAWRARHARDAADAKRKDAVPPISMSKPVGTVLHPWPAHPHPAGTDPRAHFAPCPPIPLFHTRHAEQSAERPRLITVVRPCGQAALRKVTVLLNRRGVVSFEQLLLDVSEALGFPRWHRARVTRLYTPHAREVRGVCDFFRGEVAFLALGKARPVLQSIQEALEELFPEPSHYRADALRAWEKRLQPALDKATKGDSGYCEGADSSGTHTHHETRPDAKTHPKMPHNTDRLTQPPHCTDAHRRENNVKTKHFYRKHACRQSSQLIPPHPPNHLQRLRVRDEARERLPAVTGPFKQEARLIKIDTLSPTLCDNCLGGGAKPHSSEQANQIAGRALLPPVSRKQKESSPKEQEEGHLDDRHSPPTPHRINRAEDKCLDQSQHLSSNPLPGTGPKQGGTQQRLTFDLPSEGGDITLSDIERCYNIGRVVGDGNFAVVHECRRRDNGQTVAMKIVEHSKLTGREHMMQNELSLLGSLSHPRVIRLFAHHHTHTHSYLVMEMATGGDLFEAIAEKGKFPEAEAGLMVSDVSEALSFIHSKSIVHRDLKPENLLIEHSANGNSRLKLGDFGLAMVVTEPIFTICGTPTYVAPEILSEKGYGLTVDVWALGVILYILLCGFPPFRSQNRDQEELFQLIKQGEFHFLSPYWDTISEEARSLVRALLQVDPTVRLTAAQTLQHPWVRAMSSACSQGTLTDKAQANVAGTGRDQERPAQTQATETIRVKRPSHANSQRIHKAHIHTAEIRKQHEGHTQMNTGATSQETPKQVNTTQGQSKQVGAVQTVLQQDKEIIPDTFLETTADEKNQNRASADKTGSQTQLDQLNTTPVPIQTTHPHQDCVLHQSPSDSPTLPPQAAAPSPPPNTATSSTHHNPPSSDAAPPSASLTLSPHQ